MKLVGLVLAMFAVAAFADGNEGEDATVFNGGYKLTKKSCPSLYEDGYRSAYLKVGKDVLKTEEIAIQFYGDDAQQDSILLGEGERTPLGVPRDRADKVKEKWKTIFKSETHLVSTVTTTSPGGKYTETSELKILGNNVVYTRKEAQPEKTTVCALIPNLRKKEKESACEQIRVNLDKKAPSQKDCLKGTFTVNSNDGGSIGFAYENTKLDRTLSCQVDFDKPLGKFAPAVEECEWN